MPPRLLQALLDPGWLFVLAGLGLIASAVLIPAMAESDEVGLELQRALRLEERRVERLRRHQAFLDALERGDQAVLQSLVTSQLHLVPVGERPLYLPRDMGRREASVFDELEPPAVALPRRATPASLLYKLTTTPSYQPWVIASGTMCLLLGLLPSSSRRPADQT